MESYESSHSGSEIDNAITQVLTHEAWVQFAHIEGAVANNATLQQAFTDEATDRKNGDSGLQTKIDEEAGTRATNDGVLQDNIDQEVKDRTDGDSGLQKQIDDEAQRATKAEGQLTAYVDSKIGDIETLLKEV